QTLEQTYPAPLADVWAAVTTAERIQRWFLPVSGDLRPGGRYQFEGNAGGEILACEPPADGTAEVAVTWELMGAVSWVTLRLAAEVVALAATDGGRSFGRVAADGWAAADTASGEDPAVAQQRADATYGFYTGTGQEG